MCWGYIYIANSNREGNLGCEGSAAFPPVLAFDRNAPGRPAATRLVSEENRMNIEIIKHHDNNPRSYPVMHDGALRMWC